MGKIHEWEKALNTHQLGIWTVKFCELAGGITLAVYAILGPGFMAKNSFCRLKFGIHVMDEYWWWDAFIDGISSVGFAAISFACGILIFIVGWRLNTNWDLIPMKQDLLLIIKYLLWGIALILIISIVCEFILVFFPGHVPKVSIPIVSGDSIIATASRMVFCLFCLGILFAILSPRVWKCIEKMAGIR